VPDHVSAQTAQKSRLERARCLSKHGPAALLRCPRWSGVPEDLTDIEKVAICSGAQPESLHFGLPSAGSTEFTGEALPRAAPRRDRATQSEFPKSGLNTNPNSLPELRRTSSQRFRSPCSDGSRSRNSSPPASPSRWLAPCTSTHPFWHIPPAGPGSSTVITSRSTAGVKPTAVQESRAPAQRAARTCAARRGAFWHGRRNPLT
jgi:hypothetical protein